MGGWKPRECYLVLGRIIKVLSKSPNPLSQSKPAENEQARERERDAYTQREIVSLTLADFSSVSTVSHYLPSLHCYLGDRLSRVTHL